jgi:cob(I)alamin adenosyltransferase
MRKKKISFDVVTTRNGDTGKSATFDGCEQYKDSAVFQAIGAIDELSSHLGLIRNVIVEHPIRGIRKVFGRARARFELLRIQQELQTGMSLVATNPQLNKKNEPTNTTYIGLSKVTEEHITNLERWQKRILSSEVTIANQFVPPGKTAESAHVDIARAICRRAERDIVHFMNESDRHDLKYVSIYLNRLSDALFIFARWLEQNPPAKKVPFKF